MLAPSGRVLCSGIATVFAAATMGAAAAGAQEPGIHVRTPPSLAIIDVTVVDIMAGTLRPGLSLVIQQGMITDLATADVIEIPPDAVRISATGRYVIAGLIDMHVHGTAGDFPLFVANGVTTVRIMAGSPAHLRLREQIRRRELLGPDLLVASPIIESPPPEGYPSIVTEGRRYVTTRAEAAEEVARLAAAGYDYLKVYNHLTAEAYEGLVDAARQRDLDVVGHVPFAVQPTRALRAQRTIEHRGGFLNMLAPAEVLARTGPDLRSRMMAWRHADTLRIPELAREVAASGVWFCPTFVIDRVLWPSPRMREYLAGPYAPYLDASWRERLMNRRRVQWASNFDEADFEAANDMRTVKRAIVRALNDAGAPMCAGSDSWPPVGFSLHDELREFVEAGLTPGEALRAATTSAARALRREDRGVVAVGKRADLVLLDANPLDDIVAVRRPRAVVLNGEWLPRATLDSLLETVASANRRLIAVSTSPELSPRILTDGASPMVSHDGRQVFFVETDRARERLVYWRQNGPGQTIFPTTRLMSVSVRGGPARLIASGVMGERDFERTYDVSRDGRTVVLAGIADDTTAALLTVPSSGGTPTVLERLPAPEVLHPRWSPDGRSVAYAGTRGIFVLPARGGAPRQLSSVVSPGGEVQWSPDGRHVAVVGTTERDGAFALYIVDVATGVPRRLTPESEDDRYKDGIRWHPNGRLISYMAYASGDSSEEVRVAHVDGSGTDRLVSLPDQWDWYGAWSPDARRFVFRTFTDRWELQELDLASSGLRSLGPALSVPSWSGDGKVAVWTMPGSAVYGPR